MAGTFRPSYQIDWEGDRVVATMAEAARRAINDVNEDAKNSARDEHEWENRTGQTEASLFRNNARIEGPPLRVWGEWGVADRPHLGADDNVRMTIDQFGEERPVTTKDVAFWLEFGTVKMEPRPWLYPAWDKYKFTLGPRIEAYYRLISMSGAPTAIRGPGGRFISHGVLG